jgi:hypothetical protein
MKIKKYNDLTNELKKKIEEEQNKSKEELNKMIKTKELEKKTNKIGFNEIE